MTLSLSLPAGNYTLNRIMLFPMIHLLWYFVCTVQNFVSSFFIWFCFWWIHEIEANKELIKNFNGNDNICDCGTLRYHLHRLWVACMWRVQVKSPSSYTHTRSLKFKTTSGIFIPLAEFSLKLFFLSLSLRNKIFCFAHISIFNETTNKMRYVLDRFCICWKF